MKSFSLLQPDDWHCHLRDEAGLQLTVPHQAKQFARSIIMPNLATPITTVAQAQAYRDRILAHRPADSSFTPLMTLYLTSQTSEDEIKRVKNADFVHAFKLYPAGATTNSAAGVSDLNQLAPILELLQENDIPLLMHGEVTDPNCDIFAREQRFIEDYLKPWLKDFPRLRFVLEHITSQYAVEFVRQSPNNLAATITAHHLWLNRNDLLAGGIKPHYYCLPIVKRQSDQRALIDAATSGEAKFFLGTDSAPHERHTKESSCGCAGIYTAHAALALYATIFEQANALQHLEAFASRNGPAFYQLPCNTQQVVLHQREKLIPESFPFENTSLIPFAAGQTLSWELESIYE